MLALVKARRLLCLIDTLHKARRRLSSLRSAVPFLLLLRNNTSLLIVATMISPIVTVAAFAALGAAEEVAWSGFDRWSYNSYSELGTKQADYYPEFFKNNVSYTAS